MKACLDTWFVAYFAVPSSRFVVERPRLELHALWSNLHPCCIPMQAANPLEQFFFQSRDLLSALSPFLNIDDLLQCSSLSTALHGWYDGDLTWAPRLAQAAAITSPPPSNEASRSSSEDNAAPIGAPVPEPLPLVDAIHLIEQFLLGRHDESMVDGLVFDGGSGMYHVHYSKPAPVDHLRATSVMIKYEVLRLQRSDEDGHWVVHEHARSPEGLLAVNICNAHSLELEAHTERPTRTAKAEYIRRMGCSEHEQRSCWRLLAPLPPLPTPSHEARSLAKPQGPHAARAFPPAPVLPSAAVPGLSTPRCRRRAALVG